MSKERVLYIKNTVKLTFYCICCKINDIGDDFMGFLDRFKKNNKNNENNKNNIKSEPKVEEPIEKLPFTAMFLPNGNLQVEYYNYDFKKFYDTTRLIIDKQLLEIEGSEVCNCAVSWYGRDDHKIFNQEKGKIEGIRSENYSDVLAEIDLNLLVNDPTYCKAVMTDLLDKNRVARYLETGMQDTPERPCGKYVGGIAKTDNGLKKFFKCEIGIASHNSSLMVNRRQERKEILRQQKERKNRENQEKAGKLQQGIEDR